MKKNYQTITPTPPATRRRDFAESAQLLSPSQGGRLFATMQVIAFPLVKVEDSTRRGKTPACGRQAKGVEEYE